MGRKPRTLRLLSLIAILILAVGCGDRGGAPDAGEIGEPRVGGAPFRFELLVNAGDQRRPDVPRILQQQWRRVGIEAERRPIEFTRSTRA